MNKYKIRQMLAITEESDQTFYPIDGIPKRYSMNKKGLIHDYLKNKHIYPDLVNKRYLYCRLNIEGKSISIRFNALRLMMFFPMHTDLKTYTNILELHAVDGNDLNLDINNFRWNIPEGGIPCDKYPGYYSIQGNPDIVINKDYQVIIYESFKILNKDNLYLNHGYPSLTISKKYKIDYSLSTRRLHRLICLAFYPIPKKLDKPIVNHKDGNKENYSINNLEWTSYTGNRIHAVQNGLCVQSIKITAINIKTEKKFYFNSLQEAARGLNIHAWDISKAIKLYKENKKIFIYPWLFLEGDEKIPTSFKTLKDNVTENTACFFKVENINTSNINYFRGYNNLYKFFSTKQVPKICLDETIDFNEYRITRINRNQIPKKENKELCSAWSNVGGKRQKAIQVTNLANGEVTDYPDFDSFATLVGAKRKTIQRRMLYNNNVWNGYKILYKN